MPLEPYRRGAFWWVRGKVEYNGRAISDYVRESTGSSTESGARDWIAEYEARQHRRFLLGEEDRPLTFADAVMLYTPTAEMAKALVPILAEFGETRVDRITPARAVINNAHELGRCPPIRVKGFAEADRVAQDKRRKKPSRIERQPGSWEWLLQFREHAPRYHAALAFFMFATGARVGQATAMRPDHLDLQNAKVTIPGAKGHDDRVIEIPMELVVELANLPPKTPRTWDRTKRANLRVFGFASKDGPRAGWIRACRLAGIPYLPPHSAGRHGFGQEFNVRQPVDEKAAGQFGGWSDLALMKRTYTHAEDVVTKIHAGFRTGLVQAENATGLKLRRDNG